MQPPSSLPESASTEGPEAERKSWIAQSVERPIVILLISGLLALVDLVSGPDIQFPIAYVIPVFLAAYFHRRWFALTLAMVLPLLRLSFVVGWNFPDGVTIALVNVCIRVVVLCLIAWLVSLIANLHQRLRTRARLLPKNVPLCLACKRVEQPGGEWQELDLFIERISDERFLHRRCPSCSDAGAGEPARA